MTVGKVGENIVKVILAWMIKINFSLDLAENCKLKIVWEEKV